MAAAGRTKPAFGWGTSGLHSLKEKPPTFRSRALSPDGVFEAVSVVTNAASLPSSAALREVLERLLTGLPIDCPVNDTPALPDYARFTLGRIGMVRKSRFSDMPGWPLMSVVRG